MICRDIIILCFTQPSALTWSWPPAVERGHRWRGKRVSYPRACAGPGSCNGPPRAPCTPLWGGRQPPSPPYLSAAHAPWRERQHLGQTDCASAEKAIQGQQRPGEIKHGRIKFPPVRFNRCLKVLHLSSENASHHVPVCGQKEGRNKKASVCERDRHREMAASARAPGRRQSGCKWRLIVGAELV